MKQQAILCLLLQLIFELSTCTHLRVIPGSTLELPCLPFQTQISDTDITWKFNGKDVSPTDESSDSVRVKKSGLFLSISPVAAANEGSYECLVKDNGMEMMTTYNITVEAWNFYTFKVTEGVTVTLPCLLPPSNRVSVNSVWFKETNDGKRAKLNLENDSTDENKKLERLYPLDLDQSILLRHTIMEDAGFYQCESAEGTKLSTVLLIVEAVAPTAPTLSCEAFPTAWEPCEDENSRTGGPMLQESMTEFAMELYTYVRQIYPSANLLFSPISISGALSYLLLGARGDTRRALERAIQVPHDFHCLHFQMKKLREKLSGSLQMASQIYYNPQLNLQESFTNQSIEFYDSEPTELMETDKENIQMINSWVANKTQNKITHLVDSIHSNAQLFLQNAVSFNGQWKFKFNPKPKKGYFTKLDGDMVEVPLLHHMEYPTTMIYSAELRAKVASFALSGNSSLYILLPPTHKMSDLQKVEEKMTDTAVRQMIKQMTESSPEQVDVTLPQIKLDEEPDMNILLKKLGLSSLFEGANLCGLLTQEKLVLDDAKHRAFLELNERGVEAGAITTLSFARSSPSFTALHPFIMLLWSDQANVPLFIGRVTEP